MKAIISTLVILHAIFITLPCFSQGITIDIEKLGNTDGLKEFLNKMEKTQTNTTATESCRYTFSRPDNKPGDQFYNGKYHGKCLNGVAHGQGRIDYPSGASYKGSFKDGVYHGQGTLTYKSGSTATGNFFNDNRDGYFRMAYYDGSTYEGTMKGNVKIKGRYQFNKGNKEIRVYDGEWIQDDDGTEYFHGLGRIEYTNGSVYEGQWSYGYRHGKGTLTHVNGRIESGTWKKDKKVAPTNEPEYVDITNENGDRYTGYFLYGLQHGKGTYFHASSGSRYEGEWHHGQRHGQGTLYFKNGGKYVGEFKSDKFSGYGKLKYQNGDHYEGEWRNDLRHGKGSLHLKSGSKYNGDFENDKYHGYGSFQYSDGGSYEGEWRHGQEHGQGKANYANGDSYNGHWKEGKQHGRGTFRVRGSVIRGSFHNGEPHGEIIKTHDGQTVTLLCVFGDCDKVEYSSDNNNVWR